MSRLLGTMHREFSTYSTVLKPCRWREVDTDRRRYTPGTRMRAGEALGCEFMVSWILLGINGEVFSQLVLMSWRFLP